MAKRKEIKLVVVTPESELLSTTAESIVIPAHDGELGILGDRAPLMCELGIGQLRYTSGGKTSRVFIDGGFAQVNANEVAVLTPHAVKAEAISAEMITAAERSSGDAGDKSAEAAERRSAAQRRVSVMRSLMSRP